MSDLPPTMNFVEPEDNAFPSRVEGVWFDVGIDPAVPSEDHPVVSYSRILSGGFRTAWQVPDGIPSVRPSWVGVICYPLWFFSLVRFFYADHSLREAVSIAYALVALERK